MNLTPHQRLLKLLELADQDEDCRLSGKELESAYRWLESYTDSLSQEDSQQIWAYPVVKSIYDRRLLELACRIMVFPEEI